MKVRPTVLWAAWWAIFAAADVAADKRHNQSTFSETIRELFRVRTQTGRLVFTGIYAGAAATFYAHICNKES